MNILFYNDPLNCLGFLNGIYHYTQVYHTQQPVFVATRFPPCLKPANLCSFSREILYLGHRCQMICCVSWLREKLNHTNEVITELLMNGISDWARIVCPGSLVQTQLKALKIFAFNQL